MKIVPKNPKFQVFNVFSIKTQRCMVKFRIFSTLTLEEAEFIGGCLIIHTNWVLVIQLVPPAYCVLQSVTPIDSSSYAHQDTTDLFITHKMSVDPLSCEQDITEGSFMYKISLTNNNFTHKNTVIICTPRYHRLFIICSWRYYAHEDTIDCLRYAHYGITDFILYTPRHHWLYLCTMYHWLFIIYTWRYNWLIIICTLRYHLLFIIWTPRHHWLFIYVQDTNECSSVAYEDIIYYCMHIWHK